MKTRYTILVRDNHKKENMLELGAHSVNFTLKTNPHLYYHGSIAEFLGSHTDLNLSAIVDLAEPEEKVPNVYDLDEEITQEITDCRYGHSLVTSMGLIKETTYCEKCGLEIKTDAL